MSGCGFIDFFKLKKNGSSTSSSADVEIYGYSLGAKAGSRDASALASVYAATTTIAPAAIRPDPDLWVRRLIRQFRDEGTLVARMTGDVEAYRPLLGGASEDFTTLPQETYDATSLLALMTVAESACSALVAPASWNYPGWSTILPSGITDVDTNLAFLAQRLTGLPTSRISSTMITALKTIMQTANSGSSTYTSYDAYVAPCVALLLDAEALLL